jgi:hypothetical protein
MPRIEEPESDEVQRRINDINRLLDQHRQCRYSRVRDEPRGDEEQRKTLVKIEEQLVEGNRLIKKQ